MSSLKERIELLENDLKAVPSRVNVYHDLPFANRVEESKRSFRGTVIMILSMMFDYALYVTETLRAC
jgi:hypothetical protein